MLSLPRHLLGAIVALSVVGTAAAADLCAIEQDLNVANVATPADPNGAYERARAQWASDMGSVELSNHQLSPKAVVFAQNEQDVLETIDFASRCGYSISIRSGGHQYAGYSSCKEGTQCLQLDVSSLETFEHDPSTNICTLGVGLVIAQVVRRLVPLGLVIPMGICKSVGVGGHFSTSAMGFFGRSLGLGLDHVKSFRIATANKEILDVSRDSHPALFDAVIGGGPGSFGVVLDYKVQATSYQQFPHSALVSLVWPYSRSGFLNIARTYSDIMARPKISRDLTCLLVVTESNEFTPGFVGRWPLTTSMFCVWTGADNGSLYASSNYRTYIQPFKDAFRGLFRPITLNDERMPIHRIMDQLKFDFNHDPYRYYTSSITTDEYYTPEQWEVVADQMDALRDIPDSYIQFDFQSYGGAGKGSQFNRNVGLNGFPRRSLMLHSDNWVFFRTRKAEAAVETLIKDYENRTKDMFGSEKLWMTTSNVVADESDLSELWSDYYPSLEAFHNVQDVKKEYDERDLFSTDMTIPLRETTNAIETPTTTPTAIPTTTPTATPTTTPTATPTTTPTATPTTAPTMPPTSAPTTLRGAFDSTAEPTAEPTPSSNTTPASSSSSGAPWWCFWCA